MPTISTLAMGAGLPLRANRKALQKSGLGLRSRLPPADGLGSLKTADRD
jgi:hypothetical protein